MSFWDWFTDDVLGINPPPKQPTGPSAGDIAAQEKARQDQATNDAVLANAKDAAKRKGRNALVLSGATGDPGFGSGVSAPSAYSVTPPGARVSLGG